MTRFEELMNNIPLGFKQQLPFFRALKRFYSDSFFRNFPQQEIFDSLRNIHAGKRCFVLGAGPSLNKTNLSLLDGEFVFGCNSLYKLSELSFQYYGVCDVLVWKKRFEKLLSLDTTLFLSGGAARDYIANFELYKNLQVRQPILLRDLGQMTFHKEMSRDISNGVFWGNTVIIDICLQAAFYLGFSEVVLLGCDSDYSLGGRFDGKPTDNLKGGGALGDWSDVFAAYGICKKSFEDDSRSIINATVGGRLEVFKRISLEEIFGIL